MKKVLFSFVSLFFIFSSFSQTWGLDGSKYDVGVDVGYTLEDYVPISIYVGIDKLHLGVSAGIDLQKDLKGQYYSTINWDELSEDHVSQGEFYIPFTFDVGYNVYRGFVIGAGVGYASKRLYRNYYDNTHILGNNGYYYKTVSDGGSMDVKGYVR